MRVALAVLVGKLLRFVIRAFRRGGGSALPGLVASKIAPRLLPKAIASCPMGLVVVSGSAGKSSTTHHLVALLEGHGLKVFTNPSTANIRQGLFAAVLKEVNLLGEMSFDIAVLEWDEGHGAAIANEVEINLAVLTNVLSDQLDRFVDPEMVAQKLAVIANRAKSVVVNADDKNLTQLVVNHSDVIGYGLSEAFLKSDQAPRYALNFGPEPEISKSIKVFRGEKFTISSELGAFDTEVDSAELALNYAAALSAASRLTALDSTKVTGLFAERKGVFARNETSLIFGKNVNLRLVQNPTSFQLNLDEISGEESPLMLMAGRDIHDPSWLWTVDFTRLKKVHVVSGYNAYELALRLSVAGVEIESVVPEIADATKRFFELEGDKPTILFSADAMRRFRRHTKVAK